MDELVNWKISPNRKPLFIRGARQVGKTWLMKAFGSKYYDNVAYINFENNERMVNLFRHDLNIQRILVGLQIEANTTIDTTTLIIFDEIQAVPDALASLKYFQENMPEFHVLSAGSVLGVALHQSASFPVGKIDFLDLHPMDFNEFLIATGNQALLNLITDQDFVLISNFKTSLIDLLRKYYFVGGMPEAVQVYADTQDFSQVRDVHRRLLLAYEQDFSKHAPYDIVPRIRQVWNSIPAQLSRENRKFIYGLVKQGARGREYDIALLWLQDSSLIHKVFRVTKPEIPLKAFQDNNAFKIFMLDIGLLGALCQLEAINLLQGDQIFMQFKGALTEQFVFQQLLSSNLHQPYYWSADRGIAEIDFLIQAGNALYPIEVKAEENLRSKSLKVFYQQFMPKKSVRLSMSEYRDEGWLVNLPLYLISQLGELLNS
ncbi:MAG: AAA family ATPase [Brevefilum sp.]|nr:AAA family ATPase [Brevefilum sp.]